MIICLMYTFMVGFASSYLGLFGAYNRSAPMMVTLKNWTYWAFIAAITMFPISLVAWIVILTSDAQHTDDNGGLITAPLRCSHVAVFSR